ncbi:glutathione peroxidase [Sphingomonas morindae]|uniref:Glutathione peroxidase n=1 Tax=Sphingomonas morindae TaxID=1541170 RepID=A0ABY4X6C5_9SPHN|nr:glutathione peroxidase [Sphingomonas morindae]USI72431.1 glutathione peroxidase [Sphingomonas morindae]
MTSLSDFTVRAIDGSPTPLAAQAGKLVLVVNTASLCGFTPHYEGLEALHRAYAPRGFTVLGFPCNQFGKQEPGDEASIADFCRTRFDIGFPLFAKVEVNGPGAEPLFAWLKTRAPGLLGTRRIKWNFTKFLVARDGVTVRRFAPSTPPATLRPAIEAWL